MPNLSKIETVRQIAKLYCTNGLKPIKALVDTGYSYNYAKSKSGILFQNKQLIKEIARIQDETAVKLDLSREAQHEKLQAAYKIAKKQENPHAMASAVREQNAMMGYHREKAPNAEKIAEVVTRMSEEERLFREEYTAKRCKQEAEKGFPRKIKAG